jgi:hypothetical protein
MLISSKRLDGELPIASLRFPLWNSASDVRPLEKIQSFTKRVNVMTSGNVDIRDVWDLDVHFETRKRSFGVSNKLTEHTFPRLSDHTICADFELPAPAEASYHRDSKNRD